jgi:hypothetical protein
MSMDFEEVLVAYFNAETVEEMEFEKLDNGMTRIIAHLKEGNHFTYTDNINWGNDITSFYDTLDRFTNGLSYTFNNFDPETEIERLSEQTRLMSGDF